LSASADSEEQVQGLPVSLLLAAFLAAAVVLSALRLRWLSPSGALAAFLVGWVTFASGSWQAAAVLLTFFVTSSALSRWRVGRKRRMELLTARGSRRQAAQVLANGGVATACIAVYALTGDVHWWLAFVGAYAAANADTWSSEIGALSPVPPRHVLTLRPLQPGDSGGVTVLGLLAGGAGSVVVAAVAWAVHPMGFEQVVMVTVGGLLGSLLDSVLGGTVQARYWCAVCGETVERPVHCGVPAAHAGGWRWIDNDVVNLFCTLIGATVAFIG
jgi:uncharacterized protein (TIGR00297 family)